MPYFSRPRLVLSGQFQADVSTVNNDVRHYDNATFEPRFQRPQVSDGPMNGWWNPDGSNAFRLRDLTVRQAVSPFGIEGADPALGFMLDSAYDRPAAKLVDLDPQFQLASTIFGLQVRLMAGADEVFRGTFKAASFRDLDFGRAGRSAHFNSVLTDVSWTDQADPSPTLRALRASAQANDNRLSISLMTYGYGSVAFTFGRVIAIVGPWTRGEPETVVVKRRFSPVPSEGGFVTADGFGPFDAQVADGFVTLDLSSAIPLADAGGEVAAGLGALSLAILARGDTEQDKGGPQWAITPGIREQQTVGAGDLVVLGEIDSAAPGWFLACGGVVDVAVAPEHVAMAASRPLALVSRQAQGRFKVMIRENFGGYFARADEFSLRIDSVAGRDVAAEGVIAVAQYGVPVAGVPIAAALVEPMSGMGGSGPATNPPSAEIPLIGVPQDRVRLRALQFSDADGIARIPLAIRDPGNPRGYLDGQVYLVNYGINVEGAAGGGPFDQLFLHVRDAYSPPAAPDWDADIKPILLQYDHLYPVMSRGLFSLADADVLKAHATVLSFVFELPLDDPNHMPVSRDLSAGRRQAILNWLRAFLPEDAAAPVLRPEAADSRPEPAPEVDSEPVPPTEVLVRQRTLSAETIAYIREVVGDRTDGKAQPLRDLIPSDQRQ